MKKKEITLTCLHSMNVRSKKILKDFQMKDKDINYKRSYSIQYKISKKKRHLNFTVYWVSYFTILSFV